MKVRETEGKAGISQLSSIWLKNFFYILLILGVAILYLVYYIMYIVFRKDEKMTYYGYEIYDEREVGKGFEVAMFGWVYEFQTVEEAKVFIKENK
jgi:hypothetical protein